MITYPTVHLGGTSRAQLIEQYTTACNAVQEALRVVIENGPHARDYYVTTNSWAVASQEHHRRVKHLEDILIDLRLILAHVAEVDPND